MSEKTEKLSNLTKSLIETIGEDSNSQHYQQTTKGGDLRIRVSVTLDEVINGGTKKLKFKRKIVCNPCLPIYGKAHVAYFSNNNVIGLSKMNRVVDYFSRRPQVQERLTHQVANTLDKVLDPVGVAVVMEGRHLCMQMRGVAKQNSLASTSAMLGQFRKSSETRAEFLSIIQK